MQQPRSRIAAIATALLLGACGGGGGGTATGSDQQPASEVDPGTAIRGDAVVGAMGPPGDWPLVPIHAALVPDGRVMTFGRDPDSASGMIYDIWDWQHERESSAHLTLPNSLGTDLFCSNQLLLGSGELLMAGGDIRQSRYPGQIGGQLLQGNRDANVFDPVSNKLSRRGELTEPRWYASLTMLPWGEVYVQGGALDMNLDLPASHAEVASEDGSEFRPLTGFSVADLPWYYPRNFTDRHGTIVGWTHNASYRIDPRGDGERIDTGRAPGVDLNNGSMAVMYAPGKVLLGGGGSSAVVRADINGDVPAYETVPPMTTPRIWGTATVLPNGEVLFANGGTSDTSIVDAPLGEPAYQVMLYDPASNQWREGARAARPRLYHSIAILLPDASVLLGGGGLPGPVTNLNAERYYPPYLFTPDGRFAERPVIESAPQTLSPGSTFTIRVSGSEPIHRAVLLKTGAVTHSFDMDQRFVPLSVRQTGAQGGIWLAATLPEQVADTPPGFYHLFILNEQGVPSLSSIVRITPYTGSLPSPARPADLMPPIGSDGAQRTDLLTCAPDEVFVGIHGTYLNWVRSLGPICRRVDDASAPSIRRATNPARPAGGEQTAYALQCPDQTLMSGFQVRLNDNQNRLLGLRLVCSSATSGDELSVGELASGPVREAQACDHASHTAGLVLYSDDTGATGLAMRCRR